MRSKKWQESPAQYIARVAVIAAIYVAITLLLAPVSYGLFQVRVSEALTVLPFISAYGVPGLALGVLIANIFGGLGLIDIVFGTLATFIAAVLTRRMPTPYLAPLPPVLVNAVIVGTYLSFMLEYPLVLAIIQVGAGQILACYFLGLPLLLGLMRLTGPGDRWRSEKQRRP